MQNKRKIFVYFINYSKLKLQTSRNLLAGLSPFTPVIYNYSNSQLHEFAVYYVAFAFPQANYG